MPAINRFALGAVAAAALALIPLARASAQEVTLRLHQFLPLQANVPALVLEPWMDRIEAQSDGRIAFQHFPAMQLGGAPPQLIDQVIDGVADVIWTLPGYTPGRFPRTEVFELPFMMTNAEATSRALWQVAEEWMMDEDFRDVKVLGLWVHGPGVIHSDTPVEAPADLQGLNIRAPNQVMSQYVSAIGGNAVGMPVPQVAESLSRGVIDGAIVPWEVTGAIRTSELVSNHTEFPGAPLYTAVFLLAMNQAKYDSLPDDLKQVIDDNSGLAFSAEAGRITEEADAGPRQFAVERGNTIVELSPEQIAVWQEAAQPVIEDWLATADAAGIDGTGLLEAAQSAIADGAE